MDRNTIVAFLLIGLIITGYMVYEGSNQVPTKKPTQTQVQSQTKTDSNPNPSNIIDNSTPVAAKATPVIDSNWNLNTYGRYFASSTKGTEEIIRIENNLVSCEVSTKGGSLKSYTLKKFKDWSKKYPVQLINAKQQGEMNMIFYSMDGKKINTGDLYFHSATPDLSKNVVLTGNQKFSFDLILNVDKGRIIRSFTFYADKYHFDTEVRIENLENVLPTSGYDFSWSNGLRYQEKNSVDESNDAMSIAVLNGEVQELDASKDERVTSSSTGKIDYIATKVKYFTSAIIPENFDGTVNLTGIKKHFPNEGINEVYDMSLRVPYRGGSISNKFKVYIGPIDYTIIKEYGIERLQNFGWWLFRYVGEYIIMPSFKLFHMVLPNYGITLIFFSIFIKLLIYPMSVGQMKSAYKMKLLAPEMEKLRKLHENDQSAQQKATMALYSEYGINPVGGCLPMLLQMPILVSLWAVLRSHIELRQSTFFWWIQDLSIPDTIFKLPVTILGISSVSGLALLMGLTMFVQQKQTVTDPRQKGMIYMMPVMFTFLFSNFPSGLNLYYFMFNILSIGQQYYMNNFAKNRPTLAQLKAAPKKEGFLSKKIKEAQMMAEQSKGTNKYSNDPNNINNARNNKKKKK